MEANKIKVLFLGDHPGIGSGYAATTRWFAKQFINLNYEVYTAAFNTWDHFVLENYEGTLVLPNQYHTSKGLNDNYGNAQLLREYNEKYNLDCIIFHNDFYRMAYLQELSDSIIKKVIVWLPADQPKTHIDNWYKMAIIPLMERGMRCYFISEHGWLSHKHLVPDHLKNRTGFIRHSVELEHYTPLDDEERLAAREARSCVHNFVVLRVDRNQPRKNWQATLEVFCDFAADKPDTFLICKTNPADITAPRNLNDVVKELGIQNKVIFTDQFYSNQDMRKLYGISDLFVSTTCGEGFGLALAEAMACGVPVIATGETVIPEILDYGRAGILVDVEKIESIDKYDEVKYCYVDQKKFVEKMNLLYEDWRGKKKLLKKYSKDGVKYIHKICDTKTIIGQWQEKIEATVKENNSKVTISIVTYNSEGYIEECIRSIWENTKYPNYDIVVYDSGSSDDTMNVLTGLQRENPSGLSCYSGGGNRGFSFGCNIGASYAAEDGYIMFLNPDTKILPSEGRDWIQLLKEKMDNDNKVGICGPADIIMYDKDVDHIGFIGMWCALVKTKAWKEVGELDEKIAPAYWEDFDFNLSLFKAGYKKDTVGEIGYPVWHENRHAKPEESVFREMWDKNKAYVMNKWKDYIKETKPVNASVIIAYYNKPKILDLVLNAYTKQTKKDFEIIIADDGSTDEVLDVMKKYEDDLIISRVWHEDQGFRKCKILNVAVGKAKSDCILFADGDVIPSLDWVRLHYEAYVTYGNNMITVGLRNDISLDIINNPQDDPSDEKYFIESDWRYRKQRGILETIEFCGYAWNVVYGCNFSTSKKIWSDIGGFNESFTSPGIGEDADFAIRAAVNGCHFGYLEHAKVYHIAHERQDCKVSESRLLPILEEQGLILNPPFHWRRMWLTCAFDLCRFMGLTFNEALDRMEEKYGGKMLAQEWKKLNPVTQKERDLYYKNTEFYIYDLSWYNASAPMIGVYNEIYKLCQGKKVLDFGGGIGTLTMLLSHNGFDVSYYDLDSKTSQYARKRFEFYGVKPNVYLDDLDSIKDKFDVIVATDVLEHLENPVAYVEKLSEKLNDNGYFFMQNVWPDPSVLVGEEHYPMHLKSNVTQADTFDSEMVKLGIYKIDNKIYQKKKIEKITKDSKVTIEISTKDRQSYLATLLVSLINQTFKNWELLVTDNGSDMTMVENEQVMKLFNLIGHLGHRWRCNKIPSDGLLASRREALKNVDTSLLCRIDDDLFLQPDFLQHLFNNFLEDENLAAVGGIYLFADNPNSTLQPGYERDPNCQGRVNHLDWALQVNMHPDDRVKDVEHIHSSFMHRTDVARACGSYGLDLSKTVAFREDTECTYRMKLAGYNLKVDPKAKAYHFQASGGGCRLDPQVRQAYAIADDKIFQEWLSGVKDKPVIVQSIEKPVEKPIEVIAPENKVVEPQTIWELCSYFVDRYKVDTYLEIGVEYSWQLQHLQVKRKIGIDPAPMINPHDCMIFQKTSDDFFIQDALELFKQEPIDLAFIDGLHWCEVVLRDFMNCEKYAKKDSIIIIHDILPGQEEYQTREVKPYGNAWHGDCWKAIFYLMKYRPDLDITISYSCQSFAVVRNLNPNYEWSSIDFDGVKDQYNYTKDFSFLAKMAVDSVIYEIEKNDRVSIIIGTYNHLEDCLKPCLESIIKFTDMSKVEVIVVANGCTDGTKEYVESLGEPFRLLWYDEPLGYARANNEGIKAAKYDYIVLLNNDVVLLDFQQRHGWIDMLIKPFKIEDKIGITGALKVYHETFKQDFMIFCCVMMKKSLFDEIGLLDEVFEIGGGEDFDFCMKVIKAGYIQRQVPNDNVSDLRTNEGLIATNFPIYHYSGVTCQKVENYSEVIRINNDLLMDRYFDV